MIDIGHILRIDADLTEKYIKNVFDSGLCGDTVLREASEYSVLGGGKRIRAALVIEFCRMFGGNDAQSVPFAAAIEMIHAFSLVHDDMPCMDNDDMRRGKPSCHKKFGYAEALLAGDGLLTLAFAILTSNENVSSGAINAATYELSTCAGPVGMVGGQVLDMAADVDNYDALCEIYYGKTSALILSACHLGYFAADNGVTDEDCKNIGVYAAKLGIAFQIHDDILDVKSNAETLGKPIGSDERNGKKTVLKFMTLEEAEAEEKRLTDEAIEAISGYKNNENLIALAKWLITRTK